ncbi:MAG: hypothetical protein EZS28_005815 [Streblomastix strix]|uniref:Uncharacterized protein n=1 Tax=Streblomastix strix TaxID=222440 RepID=A0A5J4WVV7_9EUKA|nr:MAG: hypothetical protein EZS28_005815 [Streblomastix strix]
MLTANADKNYEQPSSNGERKPNPWIITKIQRYHNKDYYEQIIKPLLKKNYEAQKKEKQIIIKMTLIPNKIDLQDGFILLDMQEKTANREYENEEQIVIDLKRQLIYYDGETQDIYAIKGYASKFAKKGCKFISEDPKILTVFQGYKYKQLDTIDYECLQKYLDLIKEAIAACDERIYEYILNWIA